MVKRGVAASCGSAATKLFGVTKPDKSAELLRLALMFLGFVPRSHTDVAVSSLASEILRMAGHEQIKTAP